MQNHTAAATLRTSPDQAKMCELQLPSLTTARPPTCRVGMPRSASRSSQSRVWASRKNLPLTFIKGLFPRPSGSLLCSQVTITAPTLANVRQPFFSAGSELIRRDFFIHLVFAYLVRLGAFRFSHLSPIFLSFLFPFCFFQSLGYPYLRHGEAAGNQARLARSRRRGTWRQRRQQQQQQ